MGILPITAQCLAPARVAQMITRPLSEMALFMEARRRNDLIRAYPALVNRALNGAGNFQILLYGELSEPTFF
jgi:hypothetical protein